MIFVNSISELEYYTPNPQWGCYSDIVMQPHDILLQANGFTLTTPSASVVINLCQTDGTFIEDASSYFDWFLSSFTVSGTTYYFVNIRCDNYSATMQSLRCFTLNIQITSDGTTVFNKWTQKYLIINPDVVFASGITLDNGFSVKSLENCVPGQAPVPCSNVNYVKFSCYFDCYDSFNGDYYQPGSVINGSGSYPFNFTRQSWFDGRFRKVPKEIKRTISINCRTQKTETTPKYLLTGNVVFPVWKMEEIENMLLANDLYVNDTKYQADGGTLFEQFGRPFGCQYAYKLSLQMRGCFNWQIFGCVPSCEDMATYYSFPRAFERLYDDSERLIATSPEEFKTYLESTPGTTTAESLPFVLQCPVYELTKVVSNGVLPKYIYVDEIAPAARIFPKQLAANDTALAALCNGVTNGNQVPIPEVVGGENQAIQVPVPDIVGGENQDYNSYILQIEPVSGWTLSPNYSSAANHQGEVTLNISVSTVNYTSPFSNVTIATISGNGRPTTTQIIYGNDNPNLPPDSQLQINTDGSIVYTGPATSSGEGTYYIEFFMVKYLTSQ